MIHSTKPPRAKETPAQKILRLEKELEEKNLKIMILDEMINISDKEFGTSIRKELTPVLQELFNEKEKQA